jgi:hypothetical protein
MRSKPDRWVEEGNQQSPPALIRDSLQRLWALAWECIEFFLFG